MYDAVKCLYHARGSLKNRGLFKLWCLLEQITFSPGVLFEPLCLIEHLRYSTFIVSLKFKTIKLWCKAGISRASLHQAMSKIEAEQAEYNFDNPFLFPEAEHTVQDSVIGSTRSVCEIVCSPLLLLEL